MSRNDSSAVKPIRQLAADLAAGVSSARQIVEDALERIEDPEGEGGRAFLSVAADRARATADGVDAIRRAGGVVPPFAGIPFAVKDLCDVSGEVTTAGSIVLAGDDRARANAPALQRVIDAGFIVIGRTNMTEFAFSGLGLNAHFDAPSSPWDRANRRIPGGSSSGTGVAVADGMAVVGLGTDTGGSCRIPAAFCGIVGFKPTASRVPLAGIVPLSRSLDSVGPLAGTVDCCAIVDDLFAGGTGWSEPYDRSPASIRLGALTSVVLDDLDPEVATAYEVALARLRADGVHIQEVAFEELERLGDINARGGLAAAESFHWHRALLAERGDDYDQRVRMRIEPGSAISAADYLDLLDARQSMIEIAAHRLRGFDAFVAPTVAIVPPTIDSFADGDLDYYGRINRLALRNTAIGNFLDSCSISLPVTAVGEAPVGLMLMGPPRGDRALFDVARTVESTLHPLRF